jgi:glycosyltransferase involved in cell wall biosynthesis
MKVLAFIETVGHVCFRYRLRAFAAALAEAGWWLEAVPLAPNHWRRARQLRQARRADVVILQRKLLRRWQLALLRHCAKTLIYDFDDAVFVRDSFSPKGPASRTRSRLFRSAVAAADVVIAGNNYLKQQALPYCRDENVHVIPTCVEPRLYQTANHHRKNGHVKLVWIGEHSTVPCLVHPWPMLAAVARRLPGIELRVIADVFPQRCPIPVVPRVWSSAQEAAELASADIGISWLPDDPWSNGKCGLKVLQYMAAGLPVVADAVGIHREIVVHGETGFLVTSPAEWADAVQRLAASPALRRRMGRRGRELVRQRYSVAAWAAKFVALVQHAHQGLPCSLAPEASLAGATDQVRLAA